MNKIIDYKIKKNYIKYEITKNIIYIEKIYKLLFKNTEIQYGGIGYDSIDSIKLILNKLYNRCL